MKVFISHATEDKEAIARPLAHALKKLGYDVWFDEFSLKLGDSLSESIEKGLVDCHYGVVILSPNFFAKQWPKKELACLTTKEVVGESNVILPVWHNIDVHGIAKHSLGLADKLGVSTKAGLATVLKGIKEVLGSAESVDQVDDALLHHKDFRPWANAKWKKAQDALFPTTVPSSCSWTDVDDIVRVLNDFSIADINHIYLPTGGGMDMEGATRALEDDCIEIKITPKWVWLMKPKVLEFESISPHFEMSYFRLETHPLKPSGVYDDLSQPHEELAEVHPLDYRPRYLLDEGGEYGEQGEFIPLPDDTRCVQRFLGGTFIIACKGSALNFLHGKYDAYNGQYSQMTQAELRTFMEKIGLAQDEV